MGPSLLRGNACPVKTVKMVGRVAGECEVGRIGARWGSQEGQAGCEELGCYLEGYGEPVMGFKQGRVLTAYEFRKTTQCLQGDVLGWCRGCTSLEAVVGVLGA